MYDLDKIAAMLPDHSRFSRSTMAYFNEIDSTSTWLCAQKKVDGVLCLAAFQTAGRGRRSKSWVGSAGNSILMSMGWEIKPECAQGLSLVSGLALVSALERSGVPGLSLKWPNDVLLFGKKLAGILVEACGNHYVVGVGVNVNLPRAAQVAIDQPCADLKSAGFELDLDKLVADIVIKHDEFIGELKNHGLAGFSKRWNARDEFKNKEVEVIARGDVFLGVALGVNQSGALRVKSKNHTQAFSSGVESVRLINAKMSRENPLEPLHLLLDIGNQRLKWATTQQLLKPDDNNHCWFSKQFMASDSNAVGLQLAARISPLGEPQWVTISSVANEQMNNVIKRLCADLWGVVPQFVKSTAHACGVHNSYSDAEKLGIDRWAGMIAGAKRAQDEAYIIIDAGTAVTIDYVGRDRIYAGGVIFPGLLTMLNSLNDSTGQIATAGADSRGKIDCESNSRLKLQNLSTQSAVLNGIQLAISGSVEYALNYFGNTIESKINVYVTGGDARSVIAHSRHDLMHAPALVLEGLMALAEESG